MWNILLYPLGSTTDLNPRYCGLNLKFSSMSTKYKWFLASWTKESRLLDCRWHCMSSSTATTNLHTLDLTVFFLFWLSFFPCQFSVAVSIVDIYYLHSWHMLKDGVRLSSKEKCLFNFDRTIISCFNTADEASLFPLLRIHDYFLLHSRLQ